MKLFVFALTFIIFSFTACSKDSTEVKKEIPKDIVIIDVRTEGEYNSGHIKGAKLIPYTEIADKIAKEVPDKNANIALYCRSGRRSGIALNIIKKMGYNNAENYGGLSSAHEKLGIEIVKE